MYPQARKKIQEYSKKIRLRNQQQELANLKPVTISSKKTTVQTKGYLPADDYLREINIRH
jgi:hypothetical protein